MGKPQKDFFWPSYVDLMTNLFAVTLVLFVVSYFLFREKTNQLMVQAEELKRIQNLTMAIQTLNDNKFFFYDPIYQKHILRLSVQYETEGFIIPADLSNSAIQDSVKEVGVSIIKTVSDLIERFDLSESSGAVAKIKFLIVLEGQASADGYHTDYQKNNDVLSYNRALYLKNFWLDKKNQVVYKNKSFESLPCELIVSGSGEEGRPREPDKTPNGLVNRRNQRFLVHIVPVIDWRGIK